MGRGAYVLVTPTKDNRATIAKTLAAVTEQTVVPARWVIVSDGSTDGTDEIVQEYASEFSFIRLLRVEPSGAGGFGSKVAAFHAGYATLTDLDYEFIGNLDADVSFPNDYFERLLQVFSVESGLGLAGGSVIEVEGGHARAQRVSANSVAGAVQLFRRQCFEETGGFLALPLGGEDAVAEIMARAHGWAVRTVFELEVTHHGRIGRRHGRVLRGWFSKGVTNYLLGYDPVFQVAASCYRMTDRPYVLGGATMMTGYVYAAMRRCQHVVPREGVNFLRREQGDRLRALFAGGTPASPNRPQPE